MSYEAMKEIYAKFSCSSELWKVSVAQLDFLLRGRRLHTALALVEDLIVGKCIECHHDHSALICHYQCLDFHAPVLAGHGLSNLSYDERLKALSLPRLESQCLQFDFFFCYKVIFGIADVL